jgi:thioredoxin 1
MPLCNFLPWAERRRVVATVELTKANFQDIVGKNAFIIIDFWAPWCGPCRNFAPIYESASEQHADIVFGKVNTEEEQELAAYFQIRSIPTLMIFRDQIIIFSEPGMLPANAFNDLIGRARELDMDVVRKEIAAQEAGKA